MPQPPTSREHFYLIYSYTQTGKLPKSSYTALGSSCSLSPSIPYASFLYASAECRLSEIFSRHPKRNSHARPNICVIGN